MKIIDIYAEGDEIRGRQFAGKLNVLMDSVPPKDYCFILTEIAILLSEFIQQDVYDIILEMLEMWRIKYHDKTTTPNGEKVKASGKDSS